MKQWGRFLAVLAGCVALGLLLRWTVFQTRPVAVTVRPVELGRVEDTVVNSRAGTIKSRHRAEMSPGIAGLVREIVAQKGAWVRKDEVLLQLDDREYQAQIRLAQGALEVAQATAHQAQLAEDQAQRDWKRTQSLGESRIISQELIDQAETRALTTAAARLSAEANVQQQAAALEVGRATLAKTTMKAAFDGVVLDVTTEVGEWISPSPPGVFIPPVIDLVDPTALYLSAPIDEADVARIKVGLPVRITLDAFRGKSFDGTLSYVSSVVETRQEQNRTLEVEAVFSGADLPKNLLPGLSGDLEVILEARENVLRIPTYALMEGNRVMVIEHGLLAERSVTIGLQNWSFTEITSGLSKGEQIVLSLDRPEVVAGAAAQGTEETAP